ncbi:MAG TPA: LrgB family protein [Tissierellaceae bacterium]|nr:LrgB family protein [Tissierellaceae bacterium]
MQGAINNSVYFGLTITIIAYLLALKIKDKFKLTILNPILVSFIIVAIILKIFSIDYDAYNGSAKYISFLLTPATVCLAIPLYRQMESLKKNPKAILMGIATGVMASLVSVMGLSLLVNLDRIIFISIIPKSITTAIAFGITEELGGITSITMLALLVTGITGNIIAEYVCKIFRINNPIAIGLAIGTSSHAIGTTRALEIGEVEGAMSSLSIAIAGLMTVALAPILVSLLQII